MNWNCFLSSVSTDWQGLKLNRVGVTFSSFYVTPAKIAQTLLWFLLPGEICFSYYPLHTVCYTAIISVVTQPFVGRSIAWRYLKRLCSRVLHKGWTIVFLRGGGGQGWKIFTCKHFFICGSRCKQFFCVCVSVFLQTLFFTCILLISVFTTSANNLFQNLPPPPPPRQKNNGPSLTVTV